jgi:hypothetical protein
MKHIKQFINESDDDLDFLNNLDLLDNSSSWINEELEVYLLNGILDILGRDNITVYSYPGVKDLVTILLPKEDWILQKLHIINRDIREIVTEHDVDINKIDFFDDLIYYAIDENQLEKLGLHVHEIGYFDVDDDDS